MKYCPYCGADLIEDAVSFCAECGKLPTGKTQEEKPKDTSETKKKTRKKKKKPAKVPVSSNDEPETVVDDGYDGYYDDIRTIDEGHEREGLDKELIKKIAIIIGVLFLVIVACVALMYVL
ncbi:MAG: zinc ribbon domain-containing protein [Eubacteriales bacterium]|nr:zinc ribbon domain-containing protein [Eubacteriales bacterium]